MAAIVIFGRRPRRSSCNRSSRDRGAVTAGSAVLRALIDRGVLALAVALAGAVPAAATLALPAPAPPPPATTVPVAAVPIAPGFGGSGAAATGLAGALTPLSPVDSAPADSGADPGAGLAAPAFGAAATRARTSLLGAMAMVLGEPLIQLALAAGLGVIGLSAFRRQRRRPW